MDIVLLGYGKMGRSVEEVAIERGHRIIGRFNDGFPEAFEQCVDVVIEFSTPESALNNVRSSILKGIPVICGTTGWLSQYSQAVEWVRRHNGAFLYASNFSLGVNLFFELNRKLASMMASLNYEVSITETHHIHKKDAPSGTAIALAEDIVSLSEKKSWTMGVPQLGEIPITSHRVEEVAGIHQVCYQSEEDCIKIEHTAHSRRGFALGAVLAAEWIQGKKGVFSMKDVLSF